MTILYWIIYIVVLLNFKEILSFYSSYTDENVRPSLDDIMEHIEDFKDPQHFVSALSKFFRDFKSFLQDNHSEGRRSRVSYLYINYFVVIFFI